MQQEAPARGDALASRFCRVRSLTERLAAPLGPEDQVVQSMPDVSPTKWHRAHTTWFFEEFLLDPRVPGYTRFDPAFSYLFNSYYEAVGPRHPRPQRGLVSRPTVTELARYRAHVDAAMVEWLTTADAETLAEVAPLVELGLHHEQQHQELLLMDIKHVLSCNPLDPAYAATPVPSTEGARPLGWREIAGGVVAIGHDGNGFAFDNEGPRHEVVLEPCRIADRLVTAGEWREFIADDGYRRPELWLSDGWYRVQAEGWEAPLYWDRDGDEWTLFTLGGRRALTDAEPVCHVSHYEADAFARWRDARLPTEQEWEHAFGGERAAGNVLTDDAPVGALLHPQAARGGDTQAIGDTWEWTASAYLPYPRFRPAAGAVGEYNGKFMSGQMVLRGGGAFTPPGHVRATYRNFFPPHSRWMLSGVRLAEDV